MSSVVVLFLVLAALIVVGVPIGVAIGLATLAGLVTDGMPVMWFTQKLFNTFDSFPLMAVPFFLFAGDIMAHGTLSKSLLDLCRVFAGHLRGGLAQISTLTCLFYGTLCGSAPATTAAIGGFMIPAMEEEKYPRSFATAVNSVSGVLGVMIPPSVPLILYGASGMVSITDLFLAGVIPGLLVCAAFMVTSCIICRRNGYGGIHEKSSWKIRIKALWEAKYAVMVPIIVLGFIYAGICTPTEAGAIACGYALFVETFVTRSMNLRLLYRIMSSSLHTLSMIFLMIITAGAMGTFLQLHSMDRFIIDFVHSMTSSPAVFMAMMLVLFFIIGTFMDCAATILILAPLLVPLAKSFGIHPVQFGIFMLVSLSLGFLTPPVGVNLFVGCSLSGLPLMVLSRAVYPYILAMVVVLLCIMYIPAISLFLL